MDDSQTINDTALRIERLFAAPRQKLFDYWAQPELLATWFGPEGFTIPNYEIEPRENGGWHVTMLSPDGVKHIVSGVYRVIESPSRIAFTWAWHDDAGARGHETLVDVRFEDAPGGTKMILVQREFEDAETASRHTMGWASCFACLDQELAKDV